MWSSISFSFLRSLENNLSKRGRKRSRWNMISAMNTKASMSQQKQMDTHIKWEGKRDRYTYTLNLPPRGRKALKPSSPSSHPPAEATKRKKYFILKTSTIYSAWTQLFCFLSIFLFPSFIVITFIRLNCRCSTVCSTDLDQGCEMIIFESILTTFIVSIVFRGLWANSKNWLELKI